MDALLDSIRIGVTDGASDDERRRAIDACRALVDALAVRLGDSAHAVTADELTPPAPVSPDATSLAPVVAQFLASNPFAGMTADQIFDLAIAKLRAAVGDAGTAAEPVGAPFRITLVPVPRSRG